MANKLIVKHTIDDGKKVEAEILFVGPEGDQVQTYQLWDGEAYIAIGQWTDEDVINRLTELIDL